MCVAKGRSGRVPARTHQRRRLVAATALVGAFGDSTAHSFCDSVRVDGACANEKHNPKLTGKLLNLEAWSRPRFQNHNKTKNLTV